MDQNVLMFFAANRAEWLTLFFRAATFLGEFSVIAFLSILSVYHFYSKKHSEKIKSFVISIAGSAITVFFIKHIFFRARPVLEAIYPETGSSFPSGHATMAMAFYGFLFYTILKAKWHPLKKIFLVASPLLIILIGLSRLYLGVHYLSDVLAGYAIGFIWILISFAFSKKENSSPTSRLP